MEKKDSSSSTIASINKHIIAVSYLFIGREGGSRISAICVVVDDRGDDHNIDDINTKLC